MKRISSLFLALVLTLSTAALAQDMNKSVSGRVISSSAFELVMQTDAGARLNLVLDSTTSKPAILSEGDQVTVVYKPLDTGGFQAIQVLEGTSATAAPKAAGTTTRTLTNTSPPGTSGQTGESRTTVIGTTGGYQAPGNPAQPNDPNRTMDTKAMEPMDDTMAKTETMAMTETNDTMANDMMAKDTMAKDMSNDTMTNDNSLPQTASPEPAVFVFGLVALGAAALLMRRRTTN